jgi:hypothetical protein
MMYDEKLKEAFRIFGQQLKHPGREADASQVFRSFAGKVTVLTPPPMFRLSHARLLSTARSISELEARLASARRRSHDLEQESELDRELNRYLHLLRTTAEEVREGVQRCQKNSDRC